MIIPVEPLHHQHCVAVGSLFYAGATSYAPQKSSHGDFYSQQAWQSSADPATVSWRFQSLFQCSPRLA